MKASEYFEKYFANVKSLEELCQNGKAMFKDMLDEFFEIEKKRKPKTKDAIVGIVRELNDKWNSVATKVEKKFSTKVVKRNVIWNALLSENKDFGNEFPRKPD